MPDNPKRADSQAVTTPMEGVRVEDAAAGGAAVDHDAGTGSALDTIPVPAQGDHPLLGTLIDQRYLLLQVLGVGGMGTVFRATHVLMDKPVAVKLIHAELAHMPDVAKRFEREARSASRLTHPNCITVTDFGRTDDGTLFLAMELLDGESLDARIATRGRLPAAQALKILAQVLKALTHAHEAGVVHRDLKPENIALVSHGDDEDFVKILDFGIAKLAGGSEKSEKLTQSGIVFGTPPYMSPEQAVGDDADHRVDLYAAGVMLWEMLTGTQPFAGESAMEIISQHINAPIPKLSRAGRFPVGLQGLIDRALAKKPAERFASAEEFLQAVEGVDPEGPAAEDEEDTARVSRTGEQAAAEAARARRFPWPLVVVVLAVGAGAAWWLTRPEIETSPSQRVMADESAGTDRIQRMLERADEQIRGGLPAEAVVTLKELLQLSEQQPAAVLMLGHAEFLSGDRAEAMETYQKALILDPALAGDVRLLEHLEEALKWEPSRALAARILAGMHGAAATALITGRANSARADGLERQAARAALLEAGRAAEVDFLASLTADFHQFVKCVERRDTILQMGESGDVRFLPLLEEHRPATKNGVKVNMCIGTAVMEAIAALEAIKNGEPVGDAGP